MIRRSCAVVALLALAACGTDTTGEPVRGSDALGTIEVTLPSGRVVECVAFDSGSYAGGLWCTPAVPG